MDRHLRKIVFAAALVLTCLIPLGWHIATQSVAAKDNVSPVSDSEARLWVLRLHPGDDLVDSIQEFAAQKSIEAGSIVTCVGSLDRARLRYANQGEYEDLDSKGRHFEIVSLVGTFSTTSHHLHLALGNEKGAVFGGHAGSGNRVYTTAEIVIADGVSWQFQRERDPRTTYQELAPAPR
jgi:predicted DNA-binding protein with PD1-like motif